MAVVTPAAGGARETVRQKRERDQELLVWPDLVFVEFICAILFTITFVALSVYMNAPLLNRANANITPNPSKAPWYLMNLQELLLHMDKGLAGVIVPTVALIGLMAIPYIDRSNDGQGGWFATANAIRITIFSFLFSSVWLTICILWDDGAHVKLWRQAPVSFGFKDEGQEPRWIGDRNPFADWPLEGLWKAIWDFIFLKNRLALRDEWNWSLPVPFQPGSNRDGSLDWPRDFQEVPLPLNGTWIWHWGDPGWMPPWLRRVYPYDSHLDIPSITAEYVMPILAIVIPAIIMIMIMKKLGWILTTRDIMIALFTGFILTYVALTIIGAAFRGKGQNLVPPGRVPNLEHDPTIMREHTPAPFQYGLYDARTGTYA
jgi:hypothetical protein